MENLPTSPKARKKSILRETAEWILTFAFAIGLALLLRTFLFEPYFVDGHSMNETLQDGERLFATKFDYRWGDIARFDVVICRYPGREEYFVKRVVGLPGDRVAVRGGILYLNGEACTEDYITYPPHYTLTEQLLGAEDYFVLGDNRANSNDSHIIGPLAREQIIAHVRAVYWPLDAMRFVN